MKRPWKNKYDKEDLVEIDFPIKKDKTTKVKKFFKRTRPYFRIFNLTLTLLLLSTVFLFPYPDPFQAMTAIEDYQNQSIEQRTLLITPEDRNTIFNNFDPEIEEGYCLFGRSNKTHIKIEEVIHNENPLSQSEKRIMHTCVNQMKQELPNMYLDYSYKFMGSLHTHPQSDVARPSKRNIHSMGVKMLITEVGGVASSDTVNFYSHRSISEPLPVKYY